MREATHLATDTLTALPISDHRKEARPCPSGGLPHLHAEARGMRCGQAQGAMEVPQLTCLSNQQNCDCSIKILEGIDTELDVHGELQCIDLDSQVVTNLDCRPQRRI